MFVDTNVLVYSRVVESPDHETATDRLRRASQSNGPLRISRQILREYLTVVTRPLSWRDALPIGEALNDVNRLLNNYYILEDGPEVTETLVRLCREVSVGGRQIHDANIVATMLAHRERRLLTFNTADFRRFGDRIDLV